MKHMLAVVKESAAPGAKLKQVPVPDAGCDDLLIKVRATSICGTDLHIYDWDNWAQSVIRPPLTFGHEFTGEIVECGSNVDSFRVGDVVAVESHVPCGTCPQCTHGRRHICDALKIIGIHRDGCFAEYVSIPAVCAWKIPASMPRETGSIMEPLGNAVHAVSAAGVRGRRIVVFGCGPTGLFTIATARACDAAQIVAVDVNPGRLELSKRVGAHEVLQPGADTADRAHAIVGAGGADVVFEMSGNPKAMQDALRTVRKGGTYVAFGISPQPVEIDLSNLVILRGITILGVVGRRMFETWEDMQRLLDSGKLDPTPVITHRMPLKDFDRAIATLRSRDEPCGKIVLLP